MPRLSNKKKAESVRELWQKAASNERQKWRSINQRGYDFYLNDQLTAQERDDLQEVMKIIKGGNFDLPLQLSNFRD